MASNVARSPISLSDAVKSELAQIPKDAEQACLAEAQNLHNRLFAAARFEKNVYHDTIKRALTEWQTRMGWKVLPVVRGVSGVPRFNVQNLAVATDHESRGEALQAHKVLHKARQLIDMTALMQTPAVIATAAIADRHNASPYYESVPFSYALCQHAAVTVGAAATPDLRHYNIHLPLFCAFEAGCMFAWRMSDKVLYVERPYVLKLNERHQLHCENGPAIVWYDAISHYYWRGSHVDAKCITTPADQITTWMINREPNIENRRVLLDRMGEENYILKSGLTPVDVHRKFGTLYVHHFGRPGGWGFTGRPIARLRVINSTAEPDGTFRVYWLPINPDLYNGDAGRSAHAAAASTWRTTPGGSELFFKSWDEYDPQIET